MKEKHKLKILKKSARKIIAVHLKEVMEISHLHYVHLIHLMHIMNK
jgi:hypothetical protein